MNKAYQAIEKYKTSDLKLYNELEKRITRESVSLNYLITSIHKNEFENITEYRELLLKVYKDADKTGIVWWRETSAGSGLPDSYYTVKVNWRNCRVISKPIFYKIKEIREAEMVRKFKKSG